MFGNIHDISWYLLQGTCKQWLHVQKYHEINPCSCLSWIRNNISPSYCSTPPNRRQSTCLTSDDHHVWRHIILLGIYDFNILRPKQNGRRFADDIFKCIFLTENARTSIKISLKFVPKCRINTIPALVQIMAWRRSGDKPLSEPMMVNLPTHICVTRPQWVNIMTQYFSHDIVYLPGSANPFYEVLY